MQELIADVYEAIKGDVTELETVVPNQHDGFDLTTAEGQVVRLVSDDGQIRLVVFTDAQRMLPVSRIAFDWVSAGMVELNVRAHMLASAKGLV